MRRTKLSNGKHVLIDWRNPAERGAAIAAKWAEKEEEIERLTAEVASLKTALDEIGCWDGTAKHACETLISIRKRLDKK